MLEQIQGAKLLTRVVARDQRAAVLALEQEVRKLAVLVDDFYALLGPRHWVYHESLNVETMHKIVSLPADDAEQGLISVYRDPETLGFMITALHRFPAMRARMDLIDRARIDHREGRFYAAILVLLTVMDGFVNDLDAQQRRGLHAREADELNAWDSVVGHHLGLSHAHRTFTRSTLKTSSSPVSELHRNGIVHGTLLNYNNSLVASKAWNRLFAVGDWAASIEKQNTVPEPKITWRELFKRIRANEITRQALEAWCPGAIDADDARFAGEAISNRAHDYLTAWKAGNYAAMATLITPALAEDSPGETARMIREESELYELRDFKLRRADYCAPAVCEIEADLTFADRPPQSARLRWIRETADGVIATTDAEGHWFLYLWRPPAMLNRASEA
jgi:hypothetical protein